MKKEKKKKKNFLLYIVTNLILIFILIFVLAKYYYPKGLIVKEYGIKNEKINKNINGLKIIHISDIHYKTTVFENDLKYIIKEVNNYKPDIIVFTGDLFSDEVKYNNKDIEVLNTFMNSLEANIQKFAINGEDDYANNNFKTIISTSNFIFLDNSSELIYYESNTPIVISGVDTKNPDYEKISNNDNSLYKILLIHTPDEIKNIKKNNFDLILAGHSHGGQIRIPFIGAIYNYDGAKIYNESYYKLDKTDLFISSGIGTSNYPYRFLNKPSINLYRLYNN